MSENIFFQFQIFLLKSYPNQTINFKDFITLNLKQEILNFIIYRDIYFKKIKLKNYLKISAYVPKANSNLNSQLDLRYSFIFCILDCWIVSFILIKSYNYCFSYSLHCLRMKLFELIDQYLNGLNLMNYYIYKIIFINFIKMNY